MRAQIHTSTATLRQPSRNMNEGSNNKVVTGTT